MIKNEDLNSGNQLSQGDTPGLPQGLCAGLLLGAGVCGGDGAGVCGGDGAGVCGGDGAGFAGAGPVFAGAGPDVAGAGFVVDDVDIIVVIIYAPCC